MTALPTVIVCPFCPLHCDDVTLDPQGRPVVDCDLATDRFRHALGTPTPPRFGITDPAEAIASRANPSGANTSKANVAGINGSVTEQRIAEAVRDRAKAAERIVLVTAGTDLRTARDLHDLTSADPRITLRIDASPTRQAMASAVSREGVVAATIADVRRHADQIWLLGIRSEQFPRLLERLIDPDRPATVHQSPDGISADDLASLALPSPSTPFTDPPSTSFIDPPGAPRSDPPGTPRSDPPGATLAGPHNASLADLSHAFTTSRYLAVIVGDHAFRPVEAEAAAELLVQRIHRLNADTRAVLVQLDRAATDRCVTAWRGNRVLAADRDSISDDELRIRIGPPTLASPESAIPVTLQIGGSPPDPAAAEAYVPAADVGVHRAGAVVRGDGTVTLPLSKIADSTLPTATEWLRAGIWNRGHS